MTPGDELGEVRDLLKSARRILVLTGAGVSAESGVPTFRGSDGLWKNHRPELLATPEAFHRDPRLVWEWYGWRRGIVGACNPNAAHEALARMTLRNSDARIATQNVDGLHALALEKAAEATVREPPPSTRPLELHGSLFRVRCTGCPVTGKHRGPIDATSADSLPHCLECGALLRPDIVWFGEALDPQILEEAMTLAAAAEACLVVGTSSVVQPAASLPLLTRQSGGRVVEVNPEATSLTSAAHSSLRGTAAHILPRILP